MTASRVVPAVTLAVLVALLVVGSVVGWRALTAPVSSDPEDGTAAADCSEVAAGEPVRVGDIRVSVFNAGTRQGLAGQVQEALTERGFLAGEVANAPEEVGDVRRVTVYAPDAEDPAARLVAQHFGQETPVEVAPDDLGPGVDVVVGNDYRQLATGAPQEIVAEVPASGC